MAHSRPLLHFGLDSLKAEWPEALVVIGTFDGVHRGHRAVLRHAHQAAREAGLPCVLVTFDRHPAAVLRPDRVPPAICSLAEKLDRFQAMGMDAIVVLPFNAWLSRLTADAFLEDVLKGSLRATRVVVGHDFAMGSGREGTTEWLSSRISTDVVPPYELNGERVSSTAIRDAIVAGDMARAKSFLGRPYTLQGVVVPGQQLGRTLGYPTANLARSTDLALPADGVYAVAVALGQGDGANNPLRGNGEYSGALSIGVRPTVGDALARTVEVFLLDYNGPAFYGRRLTLHLERRLRGEEKFESLDALKAQMARDVEEVRTFHEGRV